MDAGVTHDGLVTGLEISGEPGMGKVMRERVNLRTEGIGGQSDEMRSLAGPTYRVCSARGGDNETVGLVQEKL